MKRKTKPQLEAEIINLNKTNEDLEKRAASLVAGIRELEGRLAYDGEVIADLKREIDAYRRRLDALVTNGKQ